MLKLKKIHILGFKSFCDRTELTVAGTGIAVVVGPNGCGKSNILDAVSWVLGEQSAKSLRGTHMQDVIFAGTRERKALGMAEVTLTLVDPEAYEGPIPVEPQVKIDHDGPTDWDEEEARRQRAAEVEEIIANEQPGQVLEEEAADGASAPQGSGQPQTFTTGEGPQAVVLKIRRRKFQRTPQKGEIVITRRLFRTGESEYLLNGKLCRLRDIQDIFMGTGLGPESYAIIGQERIGQLLSSKPYDRRAIIEEAAGITRFKTKKRLAELRLESAKQNLARVDDIFEEVTRQMNSLKRQASKAERFAAVRDELRGRLRVVLASRMALMDSDQARLGREIAALSERINAFGGGRSRSRKAASTRSPSGATSWTARARRRRIAPTRRPWSWSAPRPASVAIRSAWQAGDAHGVPSTAMASPGASANGQAALRRRDRSQNRGQVHRLRTHDGPRSPVFHEPVFGHGDPVRAEIDPRIGGERGRALRLTVDRDRRALLARLDVEGGHAHLRPPPENHAHRARPRA